MEKLETIDKLETIVSRMRSRAFVFQNLAESSSDDEFLQAFYENTWNEILNDIITLEECINQAREL